MTTKIILSTKLKNIQEYFVHEEHECDMINFLFNHKTKKDVSTNTKHYTGVDWFKIKINKNDIKQIKETSWFKNQKENNIILENNMTIEIFSIKW